VNVEAWQRFCRFLERVRGVPCSFCGRVVPCVLFHDTLMADRQLCTVDLVCRPRVPAGR